MNKINHILEQAGIQIIVHKRSWSLVFRNDIINRLHHMNADDSPLTAYQPINLGSAQELAIVLSRRISP